MRSTCKDCGGAFICEHNRVRSTCKDCGGASICKRNRERSSCKDCGGASICPHNRVRSQCKDCGGASDDPSFIVLTETKFRCEHNRRRSRCKDCRGASICAHRLVRSNESDARACRRPLAALSLRLAVHVRRTTLCAPVLEAHPVIIDALLSTLARLIHRRCRGWVRG